MKTTPTQMRLTPDELYRLERIRRINGLDSRTSTIRKLLSFYEEMTEIGLPKKNRKKSSVAT